MSCYEFTEDWQSWKIHPFRVEVIVLLHGAIEVVLRIDNLEQHKTLSTTGSFLIVPKTHGTLQKSINHVRSSSSHLEKQHSTKLLNSQGACVANPAKRSLLEQKFFIRF